METLLQTTWKRKFLSSRLREDATAQGEIRRAVGRMAELARQVMPLTFLLLGGKAGFPALYKKVLGKSPKFFPPEYIK